MSAFNIVKFKVKPGQDEAFLNAHRNGKARWPGLSRGTIVKTPSQLPNYRQKVPQTIDAIVGSLEGYRFVEGLVEDTLPTTETGDVALLVSVAVYVIAVASSTDVAADRLRLVVWIVSVIDVVIAAVFTARASNTPVPPATELIALVTLVAST